LLQDEEKGKRMYASCVAHWEGQDLPPTIALSLHCESACFHSRGGWLTVDLTDSTATTTTTTT